ncbi:hypothetical protein SKAU_G00024380 [Synaphobranchus kaupii]|uniref:Putative nuclease HARBI1 n=1 Tax=Synaphobranchus kaupii TaxID=118154 RepID=A0A9Q1JE86_SYNKA|nr:hypothetical protein SKAU_G00024380 [Synaphobranchus kaupii]
MSDRSGMSQPSLSRILPQVIEAILHVLSRRYISYPFTADEQARVKAEFVRSFNFPGVIGAVDCTHIALRAPSVDEHAYVNRKNFHSLNVQIICDARMQLLNVCSKWPGSTHDSFILRHSRVGLRLEAGESGDGWLLAEELRYNLAHGRTRSVVERTIGLLKGRWRCLDASGGKLLYKPEKVTRIILACGVLHNIALRHGIGMDAEIRMDPQKPPNPPPNEAPAPADAVRRRRQLIQRLVTWTQTGMDPRQLWPNLPPHSWHLRVCDAWEPGPHGLHPWVEDARAATQLPLVEGAHSPGARAATQLPPFLCE